MQPYSEIMCNAEYNYLAPRQVTNANKIIFLQIFKKRDVYCNTETKQTIKILIAFF